MIHSMHFLSLFACYFSFPFLFQCWFCFVFVLVVTLIVFMCSDFFSFLFCVFLGVCVGGGVG